jgi:hypothetical protein
LRANDLHDPPSISTRGWTLIQNSKIFGAQFVQNHGQLPRQSALRGSTKSIP